MKLNVEEKKTIEKASEILYRISILNLLEHQENLSIGTDISSYSKIVKDIKNMEVNY